MSNQVYSYVTETIIAQLKQGRIPWRKTWQGGASGMPSNVITRKPYSGINSLLLSCLPYSSPFYGTYKQIASMGGNVIKGSKSHMVCFFKMNPTGQHDAKGREKLIPMLRYYNVFNIEQTQGLSIEAPTPKAPFNPIEACEKALASYKDKPMLQHKGNRACYSPALDIVNMPNREAFNTREDYYATLFHELAHSTGHEKRLARAGLVDAVSFGSETYSKEELVAEIASSFLCTQTGIEQVTLSNSVAYIQGWLSKLSDDETLIVKAASQAKKASEYILGTKEEKEETE